MKTLRRKVLETFSVSWSGEIERFKKPPLLNKRALGVHDEPFPLEYGEEKVNKIYSNFDVTLSFIEKTVPLGSNLKKSLDTDFVCTSELLFRILREEFAPPERQIRLIIHAVRRKGVIFLKRKPYDKSLKKMNNEIFYEELLRMTRKLNQMITLDDEMNEKDTSKWPKYEEFKAVIKSTLTSDGRKPINLFYTSNISCSDEEGNLFLTKFIRLQSPESPEVTPFGRFVPYTRELLSFSSGTIYGYGKKSIEKIVKNSTTKMRELGEEIATKQQMIDHLYDIMDEIRELMDEDGKSLEIDFYDNRFRELPQEYCNIVPNSFLDRFA